MGWKLKAAGAATFIAGAYGLMNETVPTNVRSEYELVDSVPDVINVIDDMIEVGDRPLTLELIVVTVGLLAVGIPKSQEQPRELKIL